MQYSVWSWYDFGIVQKAVQSPSLVVLPADVHSSSMNSQLHQRQQQQQPQKMHADKSAVSVHSSSSSLLAAPVDHHEKAIHVDSTFGHATPEHSPAAASVRKQLCQMFRNFWVIGQLMSNELCKVKVYHRYCNPENSRDSIWWGTAWASAVLFSCSKRVPSSSHFDFMSISFQVLLSHLYIFFFQKQRTKHRFMQLFSVYCAAKSRVDAKHRPASSGTQRGTNSPSRHKRSAHRQSVFKPFNACSYCYRVSDNGTAVYSLTWRKSINFTDILSVGFLLLKGGAPCPAVT